MSQVQCRVSIPPVDGLDADKLTVGRHVNLNCSGDLAGFDSTKASFKMSEAESGSVKLLKVNAASSSEINLDLTYYKAGAQQINQLILTDGTNEINLNAPAVNFETVLKPSADGQPQKPFGSVVPIPIGIPLLYFIIVLIVLITAVTVSVLKIKRLAYYKELKKKLKNYQSPLEPDTQFYKSVRQAEKIDYPVEKLENAFRVYVLRAYQLPIFDLSDQRVLRYFKANFPKYKSTRASLEKILSEFDEIKKNKAVQITLEEKRDLVKKLYRFVDANKGLGQ